MVVCTEKLIKKNILVETNEQIRACYFLKDRLEFLVLRFQERGKRREVLYLNHFRGISKGIYDEWMSWCEDAHTLKTQNILRTTLDKVYF
jgi:hypothetical protein